MIPHPLFLIPLYHHILLLELLLPAPNNLQHIITKGQEISEEFFLVFKYKKKTNDFFLQISESLLNKKNNGTLLHKLGAT